MSVDSGFLFMGYGTPLCVVDIMNGRARECGYGTVFGIGSPREVFASVDSLNLVLGLTWGLVARPRC